MTTVDKSEDTYGLSIGDSQIIQYNPFLDKLLLYDYKVANNLISASTANRNAALDENSYERTIPLMVTKGVNKITTGYTIELYQVNSILPASQASINPDEILHRNIAMVQWNGEIVPIPAPIIRMVWFTDSANKTGVQWQEGENCDNVGWNRYESNYIRRIGNMAENYSAQNSITIKRLRSNDSLMLTFENNGIPLFQAVDEESGAVSPDWV